VRSSLERVKESFNHSNSSGADSSEVVIVVGESSPKKMSMMSEKLFKVIIIGDPTVGKTSFVQRYVQDSFKRDYKGTVGVDFALKIIKWSENQTVKLQLWDIAGKHILVFEIGNENHKQYFVTKLTMH